MSEQWDTACRETFSGVNECQTDATIIIDDLEKQNSALKKLAERAIGFLSVNGIYSKDLQEELDKIEAKRGKS